MEIYNNPRKERFSRQVQGGRYVDWSPDVRCRGDRPQLQSSQERMNPLMNKCYVLRLTTRLLTLAVLTGCLLMLAPAKAEASWLDCNYNWTVCGLGCWTGSGWDSGCLGQCDLDHLACMGSNPSGDEGFKITP